MPMPEHGKKPGEGQNNGLFFSVGEDVESPFAALQVLLDDEKEQNLLGGYKKLGKDAMGARLRNIPLGKGLRVRSDKLDSAAASESPELRLACFWSFSEGLGITTGGPNEKVSQDRMDYLLRTGKPSIFLDNIREGRRITPAAGVFLSMRIELGGESRQANLEQFLKSPENKDRITKLLPTVVSIDTLSRHVDIGDILNGIKKGVTPKEIVICLSPLLVVYSEWLTQEYQAVR